MKSIDNKKGDKKEDLVKKMSRLNIRGWSIRNTGDKLNKFIQYYDIDSKYIYENPGDNKQRIFIDQEYKDLFYVLLRADSKNPYKKDYSIDRESLNKIIEYYDEVIRSIDEELDYEDKYNIMNSYSYITMIQERKGTELIIDKLKELEVAMNKVQAKDRADFFKDMYMYIDEMILRLYEYKYDREEQEHMVRYECLKNIQSGDDITKREEIIKLIAQKKAIDEQYNCKNINDFLAEKLKEKMQTSTYQNSFETNKEREARKLQEDRIKRLLEKYKDDVYNSIERKTGMSKEEIISMKVEEKETLINEINSYINSINEDFDNIQTIEDKYRNILNNINNKSDHIDTIEINNYEKEKLYYEGYLKFIDEIKQECKIQSEN